MIVLRRNFYGVATITLLLSLSSCSSILPKPKPAPTVYRLSIPESTVPTSVIYSTVVNIEFPQAPRALSGTDIVLSPDGRRLTAAASASWAEPVPNQVRHALIDSLVSYEKVTGVVPKGGTRAPYRLNMQIRRFEAEFDNGAEAAPNALVHINVTLTDTKSRTLVGVYSVKTHARANTITVSSIVQAQDEATSEAMNNISAWLDNKLVDQTKN